MGLGVRVAPTTAARATSLLRAVQYTHPPSCPCHSSPTYQDQSQHGLKHVRRSFATPIDMARRKEYAFEMAASSIRFGPGCTKEVGMDFKNMGAKKVCVVTDVNVAKLDAMKQVVHALSQEGVDFTVYERTMVEPKDSSIREAIEFSKAQLPDAFLAVGGGSVIDTAKLMNLYTNFPENDFLDFVNAPLGRGLPIIKPLSPLIAVPTTAGTGSETTGTAIFDLVSKKAKTGIAHRALKPTLGICDPLNTRTMPSAVHASSGLDVLCHSLESWTAIPYTERIPRPTNPINRPAYQGANPISDIFSLQALKSTIKYLPRAVKDPDDTEAQSEMLLAATLAGVGFGNAGVHLCHGMSYPISGQNKGYKHPGYVTASPIIPHGVSVAVTAPSVFRFTGASNPDRHLAAAEAFGVDISRAKKSNAGEVLGEAIAEFLVKLGDQPRGLKALGFERKDIEGLVEGTVPQKSLLKPPRLQPPASPRSLRHLSQLHLLRKSTLDPAPPFCWTFVIMIIYKDIVTGDEIISDTYELIDKDDAVYEVNCKMVTRGGESFDIGANPSAEEADEGTDDNVQQVIDVVDGFRLNYLGDEQSKTPAFPTKKDYMGQLKTYMKKVVAKLKEGGADEEKVKAFQTGAQNYYTKHIAPNFKDFEFYTGESMDPDGMVMLLNYREDGVTPYLTIWKGGLTEMKV